MNLFFREKCRQRENRPDFGHIPPHPFCILSVTPCQTYRPAPTHLLMYRVSVPCLSLWERWPSAARTERVNNDHLVLLFKKAARPSQSPAVTALPKGEPRVCTPLYRRIPAAACTPRVLVPLCSTARSSAPTHVYRTCALSLPCQSEPVLTLAWESASPRPQARNSKASLVQRRPSAHTGLCVAKRS